MPDRNLYSLIEACFAQFASRPAILHPDGRILLTYAELRQETARYANALEVLGVVPGDRVTAQVEKSVPDTALYLACLKTGAVYQPLNNAYTAAEVDYFISDAEPKLIVCDPARQSEMRAFADRHHVAAVVSLSADGQGSLTDLARRMSPDHATVAREGDDLASLIYTSGTTGRSKGAMLSHHNLSSNALTLNELWAFSPDDVLLHALPIYHVHGLFVALNTAFLSGASLIWFDRFDLAGIIDALPRATVMMGVPTFYTRLLGASELTSDLCRDMRLFISGSAPLLAETHRSFAERTGHTILERYGMTETGMITSNPYDGARIAGTVGFPLAEVEVRIANAHGRELPRGEIGVIEVRGPNVFKGYWRMPEKTAEDFRQDEYFITGDIGTMDAQGRVTISGRAKDVIITGGFNVYPKEIEQELDNFPGVIESAVIGVPHPDYGEGVVAVITSKSALPSESSIIAALSGRLARFKLPKRIFMIDEMPRNAMGKLQKADLRRRYAEIFSPAGAQSHRQR